MKYIYKVLTQEDWDKSSSVGSINTDLDRKDGFIHFSSSKQLALTIRSYFDEYKIIVLLQIKLVALKDRLIFEKSESEERKGEFPHLYGKLLIEDVCKKWELERNAFELPIEVLKESENVI